MDGLQIEEYGEDDRIARMAASQARHRGGRDAGVGHPGKTKGGVPEPRCTCRAQDGPGETRLARSWGGSVRGPGDMVELKLRPLSIGVFTFMTTSS